MGLGWRMRIGKDRYERSIDLDGRGTSVERVMRYWESRSFYPLTYPITVGPCAITTTLSLQAKELLLTDRLCAFAGLGLSLVLISTFIYFCYAYAPVAAKTVSPRIVQGLSVMMPFLALSIGGLIVWNALRSLLAAVRM